MTKPEEIWAEQQPKLLGKLEDLRNLVHSQTDRTYQRGSYAVQTKFVFGYLHVKWRTQIHSAHRLSGYYETGSFSGDGYSSAGKLFVDSRDDGECGQQLVEGFNGFTFFLRHPEYDWRHEQLLRFTIGMPQLAQSEATCKELIGAFQQLVAAMSDQETREAAAVLPGDPIEQARVQAQADLEQVLSQFAGGADPLVAYEAQLKTDGRLQALPDEERALVLQLLKDRFLARRYGT